MADFSKITDVNGNQFNVKDATARQSISELTDALSTKVSSVNEVLPDTNGNVAVNAENIPAQGYGNESASGNPITITDGTPSTVKNLDVSLEPIQDLHGYDNPWPAGGGANIWDEQWEAGAYDGQGNKVSASRLRCKNKIPVTPSTSYYAVCAGSYNSWLNIVYFDANEAWVSTTSTTVGRVFTTPSDAYYMAFNTSDAYGTTYLNDIAINYPSTVTTYSPYSNICPISGYDSVSVQRTGKNIFDLNAIHEIDTSVGAKNGYEFTDQATYKIKPYATYAESGIEAYLYAQKKYADGTYGSIEYIVANQNTGLVTITVESGESMVVYDASGGSKEDAIRSFSAWKFQVSIGSEFPAMYEPYSGSTATISLTSAGTVYGGTLDFDTGVLTVTDENIASYNGETLPSTWISDRDVYSAGGTPTTGAQVVYKLATPQTYQLTPAQLTLIKDYNYITSNGTTISLDYYGSEATNVQAEIAEFETSIDRLTGSLATIETSPATATHAVGDLIVWNSQLYKVISAIAVGETLSVGTNVAETSVGDEITTTSSETISPTLGTGSIYCYRSGNTVTVKFSANGVTATTSQAIATLPAKYRPKVEMDFVEALHRDRRLYITPEGYVKIETALSNDYVRGCYTYVV